MREDGLRVVREVREGRTTFTVRRVQIEDGVVVAIHDAPAFAFYLGEDPDELTFLRSMTRQIAAMSDALHEAVVDFDTRAAIELRERAAVETAGAGEPDED
jgi:hypothetical protein